METSFLSDNIASGAVTIRFGENKLFGVKKANDLALS